MSMFMCKSIGLVSGDVSIHELPDGTFKAECPVGYIFGTPVEGVFSGIGSTQDEAVSALEKERQAHADAIWSI